MKESPPRSRGGGPEGRRGWLWSTFLFGAVLLVAWGWFVLGFLTEPSAVGRMRAGLIVIGGVSIALGIGAAIAGVWMLFARRT